MNNLNAVLRRYYRMIRSYLPCSGKLKKCILDEIQINVGRYLEENPEADFAQIEARFGTPQTIAAAYVDDMDTQELLQALRIRRKITATVTACVLIVLLMWGITMGAAYKESLKNTYGTVTSVITED